MVIEKSCLSGRPEPGLWCQWPEGPKVMGMIYSNVGQQEGSCLSLNF